MRVGIVGAGIMGRFHARTLQSMDGVDVLAVASRGGQSARDLAEELPSADAVAGWQELVTRDELDAVVVATPDAEHADIAIAALDAGKSVLVEKPLATTLDDAGRMVTAAENSGRSAGCLFNHRWVPSYAEARRRAPELGRALMAYAHKNDRISVAREMLSWSATTTSAWFLSSHDIDLITWIIGQYPTEVFATAVYGALREEGIDTPDAMQIQVRYDGGAVATFESCWVYPNSFPTLVDSYLEVVGTAGVVHIDRKRDQLEICTDSGMQWPSFAVQRTVHGEAAGSVRDCLADFVRAHREGRNPLVPLGEAAVTTAVLAAAHESATSGHGVAVADLRSASTLPNTP
ncbi:Gfo/Idh/MocA family protein [Saccharopolyspora sp. NPDC002376]